MHVQRLKIENIRSIREFDLDLRDDETTAGWHVLLGDNGSGKSTVVRALALALMGEANALATRQDWSRWCAAGSRAGRIRVQLSAHGRDRWSGRGRPSEQPVELEAEIAAASGGVARNGSRASIKFDGGFYADRTVWGTGSGWFSASFGAFRRFSGSNPEMDRLYLTHPQLAAHLSAFGENVALGESLRWLRDLRVKMLEEDDDEAEETQRAVIDFVNGADLLPHGARIEKVMSERVMVADGRGARVGVEDMSDGYRSILSLIFELLRLLFATSGAEAALSSIDRDKATVALPGVVAIDEIDAHLHPEWQKRIGDWFVNRFPETQFIVTTHSPIACRAAAPHGSVWLLPAPDSGESPRRVVGSDLDRLVDGDVLDAYGTGLFGADVTRSERSKEKRARLAQLNRKRLKKQLSSKERRERDRLRAALPSDPVVTAPPGD